MKYMSLLYRLVVVTVFLSTVSGCGYITIPRSEGPYSDSQVVSPVNHECKLRAIINSDYQAIKFANEEAGLISRLGVLPFFVPVTFSSSSAFSKSFQEDIAIKFTSELLASGDFNIVEYHPNYGVPYSREDFFMGNLEAINIAHRAGYSLVMVGYLDENIAGRTHRLHAKLIDVTSAVTLWSGTATVESKKPVTTMVSEFLRLTRQDPSVFDFDGITSTFASCVVDGVLDR